jgi:hypothetical protein
VAVAVSDGAWVVDCAGVIIQPMALDHKGQENIDVVNFGNTGIVRCKKVGDSAACSGVDRGTQRHQEAR